MSAGSERETETQNPATDLEWFSHTISSDLPSPAAATDGHLPALVGRLVGEGLCVYVTGPAGCGKSTLAFLCLAYSKFKTSGNCFRVDCRKVEKDRDEGLSAIEGLAKHLIRQRVLEPSEEANFLQSQSTRPENNVFVFDNVVETDASALQWLLRQPGGKILLSRHEPPVSLLYRHHIRLGGFDSAGTALQFVKHQLFTAHKGSRTQPLEIYLSMHHIIKSLCIIPRMAVILCDIYSRDSRCIKDTETSLVHRMVLAWMKMELVQLKEKSLYKLPKEEAEHFLHICRIAFEGILHRASKKDEPFSLLQIEVNAVNLQSGFSSLDEVNNYGLIQSKGNTVRSFIHPVIQEFLAAFHISSQPQNHQISFYNEQFLKNVDSFLNLALFHFGLTRLETEEFFNPSKIILAPMIESLAHVIEKKAEFRFELQILIVGCLFEAQDTTLVKHYTQQFTPLMNINFPDVRALDDARMTAQMIFVILQSGINLWEIIIPNENARGKTDSLVFPITMIPDTSVSIEVKVQPSMSQSFTLGAIFEPKTPAKTGRATEMLKRATNEEEREMYFKLAMICTGQRETLHRVTQLYSPVPVRSDATDPAYASLIACDCVEKTLATEVVFEPIHPIHMVQLGSKSKKAKAAEGDQDVTSRRHMEQKHKSCYMEMIVLNRPSVKSITFQPPGGSQPCRLVMSGEKDSPSTSGRIAMEANIEKVLEDSVGFTECVPVTEKEHGKSTMVPHGLPLPKSKSKMEADKGNVRQGAEVSGSRVHNNDGDIPATAAQVAPSHKHFQDQDILPYNSPALAQAESSEKIMWRPGMIMHSTIPDVFQKHKTYPLPEEDKQIRRGGNGQIFATEYFGYSLVAKKTLFRNREYNIILRLNHANIVPLLALMVGEVSHRRRFYCYHMLPRMSGDAARMLSDHPELTLATLKEKNSEDPRKFGLALGNMRYLLAEVLKGIAYMHSLHVVHRDVKASNILVRFHCQHENLLWCTCPHKYTVCVCDFDAAVEMDEEDKMLPISSTNQVFYLPPVGTQGFRSPEGSQLVVASHRDSIDPQLTPQTDIWSLGVLMLRLFLGEDGPGSQRQNAILQLKYHQTKRNVEGRHRNMQELVEDPLVEKILKLPLLRAKLSGVNHLVGFVSGCLRLDPQERPSASDLLKHKFLY